MVHIELRREDHSLHFDLGRLEARTRDVEDEDRRSGCQIAADRGLEVLTGPSGPPKPPRPGRRPGIYGPWYY
jgi:hypothetical protein